MSTKDPFGWAKKVISNVESALRDHIRKELDNVDLGLNEYHVLIGIESAVEKERKTLIDQMDVGICENRDSSGLVLYLCDSLESSYEKPLFPELNSAIDDFCCDEITLRQLVDDLTNTLNKAKQKFEDIS